MKTKLGHDYDLTRSLEPLQQKQERSGYCFPSDFPQSNIVEFINCNLSKAVLLGWKALDRVVTITKGRDISS